MAVVRCARESRRWVEEREERRERWCENWAERFGALVEMDWWARTIPLDLKLVSVKLVGFGRAFPTFSLGFLKSFFLSFFFFVLDPIACYRVRTFEQLVV